MLSPSADHCNKLALRAAKLRERIKDDRIGSVKFLNVETEECIFRRVRSISNFFYLLMYYLTVKARKKDSCFALISAGEIV